MTRKDCLKIFRAAEQMEAGHALSPSFTKPKSTYHSKGYMQQEQHISDESVTNQLSTKGITVESLLST